MNKALLILGVISFLCSTSQAESFPAVEIYQNSSKAVVLIIAHTEGIGRMVGAGSVIVESGTIVTNAHVVLKRNKLNPQESIQVYYKPDKVTGDLSRDLGRAYDARVIAFDAPMDLAILEVADAPSDTGVIELADPKDIRIGEEVVTIGHPEQGGLWTLSYGRISGEILNQKNIKGKNVYQTDASVNRGNSGGPLLDRRGYMAGINTNIARIGAGSVPITGVNFAITSSAVKQWVIKQGIAVDYGSKALERKNIVGVSLNDRPKVGDDKILTAKKPYLMKYLFERAEEELEDMMKDMRDRIGRR